MFLLGILVSALLSWLVFDLAMLSTYELVWFAMTMGFFAMLTFGNLVFKLWLVITGENNNQNVLGKYTDYVVVGSLFYFSFIQFLG